MRVLIGVVVSVIGAGLGLGGCLRTTSFTCDTSGDCAGGTCEAVGFCSFADSSCASGSRFGQLSGSFANQCVGGDPTGDGGVDAALSDGGADAAIDAPPQPCPASYAGLVGAPGHVYRSLTTITSSNAQRAACAADGGYLAIPDDLGELTAIFTLAGSNTIWVGITDEATEGVYKDVKGAVETFLPWAAGQPDNGPGGQADCVLASPALTYADDRCSSAFRAVCECEPPL
jgi:hypothetical protein